MKKIFLVSMSFSCFIAESSMLHRSLKYVENPTGKAAVRKSVNKISNVDLPRIANEAWRDLLLADHCFIDSLINDETRVQGYQPLGLVAEDIKEIETFIRRFYLSGATQTGIVQSEYLQLPYPKLPRFLEAEYDYKNYEIIDSILSSYDYNYLGPKEIRVDVANYLFQKFNKNSKNIGKERHLFVLKGKNPAYQETFKQDIITILNSMEKQPEYISNLEEDSIDPDRLYLIVRPQDLIDPNLNKKLEHILQDAKTNPALQVIVVFDHQQNQIPNSFKISDKIKHVAFVGKNVTSIGNDFLKFCWELESVDLSGFKNVTSIGDYFLMGCSELQSVDLIGFKNITSIGNSFLSGCNKLESVDLSVFKNITSIGNSFLNCCSKLESVDLSVFKNITSIGNSFLYGCFELQSVDLSVFKNVTSIGNYFLTVCLKLESVDLSVFKNVTSIGNYFLAGCLKLQSVDLSGFKNVRNIGDDFLFNSSKLDDVTIHANLIKLLPANFFSQFVKLKEENIHVIDLNPSYEHQYQDGW